MKEMLKYVRKDDEIERPASLVRNARIQITQQNSFATLRCHLQFARTHCDSGYTPAHLAQFSSVTPGSTPTVQGGARREGGYQLQERSIAARIDSLIANWRHRYLSHALLKHPPHYCRFPRFLPAANRTRRNNFVNHGCSVPRSSIVFRRETK